MADRQVGPAGEQSVAEWLTDRDFEVLARNARVGRLELDIVARRGALLVFCEVKTARSGSVFAAAERLGAAQQRRLRQAAAGWLRAHPQRGVVETRFDAAFVQLAPDGACDVTYYEAAF